ncbi:methyl-accepting chemotaxis protein, partial [Planobispora rosea]
MEVKGPWRLIADRRISTKILIAVAILALTAVVTGMTGLMKINSLGDVHDQQVNKQFPLLATLQHVALTAKGVANDERGFLLSGDPEFRDESLARFTEIETGLKQARTFTLTPDETAQVDELAEDLDGWKDALEAEYALYATDKAAAIQESTDGGTRKLRKAYEEKLQGTLTAIGEKISANTAFNETADSARFVVILVLVLGLIWGVLSALMVARVIVGPVRAVADVLKRMAHGDLTGRAPVRSKDEIGQMAVALNQAAESMQGALRTIDNSSDSLASASEALTATSTQIAASAEETSVQAGVVTAAAAEVSRNVETVAAGAEEMGASIREISHSANEAAKVASQAVVAAQSTNDIVGKLGTSSA